MSEELKINVFLYCSKCKCAIGHKWHDIEPYAECKCPKCGYEFTLHLGGE